MKANQTKIVLGLLTLVGVIGAAVLTNWEKFAGSAATPLPAASASQSAVGNNNVQVSGSNNVVNPLPTPKPCRDKSHGIERYGREFDVDRYSQWMDGGYSQDPWCNAVIATLRGEYPDGAFDVVGKSEKKKSTCKPANCPVYQYYCKVHVKADPIYVEKLSSACD